MISWLPLKLVVLVLLAFACVLPSCASESGEAATDAELVSEVVSGPVTLRVESDRDTLRTVDRARVRVRVVLDAGASLTGLSFETADSDWSVIEDRTEPVRSLGEGRAAHARTLTLEPFLDGAYTIPSFNASWARGEASGVATSEPLMVSVTSVLDEDDALEISEARAVPPEEVGGAAGADGVPGWVLGLSGGALLIGGIGMALWLMRRPAPDPAKAVLVRLERVAGGAGEREAVCAEAAEALRLLSGERSSTKARRLIDELDDARFAPAQGQRDRVDELVRDALELCRALVAARGTGA